MFENLWRSFKDFQLEINLLTFPEDKWVSVEQSTHLFFIKQLPQKHTARLLEWRNENHQKRGNKILFEAQEKLKLKFASVAAPDQSSDFIKNVIDETDISFKEDREIHDNLKNLIQIYQKSDTLQKKL